MSEDLDRPFEPDWYSPTGVTVGQCMADRGVTVGELSCHLGEVDTIYVEALLVGDAVVGDHTASVLARVFGGTREFWLNRDRRYWADRRRIEGQSRPDGHGRPEGGR